MQSNQSIARDKNATSKRNVKVRVQIVPTTRTSKKKNGMAKCPLQGTGRTRLFAVEPTGNDGASFTCLAVDLLVPD